MALRTDLPKIPVNDKPTIFNGTMGKWAFWGGMAGSFLTAAVLPASVILAPIATLPVYAAVMGPGLIGTALGAFYGGGLGKKKMQMDLEEGKTVKEPTFWNNGILSSATAVGLALMAVDLVMIPLGFPYTGATQLVDLALVSAAGVFGGYDKKLDMEKEFNQSLKIRDQESYERGLSQHHAKGHGRGLSQEQGMYTNSVSPQEAAMLESRMQKTDITHADKAMEALDQAQLAEATR